MSGQNHNRKLRAVLLNAGIELGEFEDEVVQGASKVIEDFAYKDAEPHIEKGFRRERDLYDVMWGIRIELNADAVSLLHQHSLNATFEVSKVFVCPLHSFEAAIERVT
jgi:hypothetical protein